MYGVPVDNLEKTVRHLQEAHITSVFVPPHQPTISHLSRAGLQVYLTLNVFGGTEAWRKYPDSVPITASGQEVSSQYGGICPTHFGWRKERLALLSSWLKQFTPAEEGIDGVWLDSVRYPGHWEAAEPEIPDTCYCPRCLAFFQAERGITLPEGLRTAEAARWIQEHAALPWLQWKKEQITSFVREARSLVDQAQNTRKIRLGVFMVPWTQGERQGAVLFQLAQDATQIARYADVLSPMVYHQMVNQPVAWIREISEYFLDISPKVVWPIIQSGSVTPESFHTAVQAVAQSGAEGLLVFTWPEMTEEQWPLLQDFEAKKNLLPNPFFEVKAQGGQPLPMGWQKGNGGAVRDTHFFNQAPTETNKGMVGIATGLDRQGAWQTTIPECDPRNSYRFTADLLREDIKASAYPEIEIWGRQYVLDTHRIVGEFQRLRTSIECPEDQKESERSFAFKNNAAGSSFWLRNPELVEEVPSQNHRVIRADTNFFPIGSYGATVENIAALKEMGLNSAVIAMDQASVDACIQNSMHCLLSVPHNPTDLVTALTPLDGRLRAGRFSFYVNDEPEIHSFPRWKAQDIQRILHDRFPAMSTSMAVVRPQSIPDYASSADLFMLDQYPVPSMPLSWLSESMDQAARHVGRNRLQSVVQAFGGSEWSADGWPRLPTFEEMNCLAFLSVIHGSRGIYFYSYPSITADTQGRADFQRVVKRLHALLPWLEKENNAEPVAIAMVSANRYDPKGNPAVHCTSKEKESEHLLMCVNTIPTYVTASLSRPVGERTVWREFFDGSKAMTVNAAVQLDFQPLEVRIFVTSPD